MAAQLAELNIQRHAILRRREVERRTGLSRTTLYDYIAAGNFPRPVLLGGKRSVGWYEHEVEAFLSSLPRASAGSHLVKEAA